ncbi:outer membrane protein [Camelimonas fluminis]|uniref:Outer membrane protein n=1 Tax=Camelimonas fluminis TaxID=1576911 RepID=A0ABV7UH39_9HYPH
MYRSLGLAIVVVSSMATGAVAADLPSRKYAPVAPVVVAPAFTWTGFYVGLNAGYGFGDSQIDKVALRNDAGPGYAAWSSDDRTFTQWNNKRSGSFVGGGQIGYNYQIDAMVIGLEVDINYADLSSERSGTNRGAVAGDSQTIVARSSVNWFGTVRPRIGALVNDRLLIFATGGLAVWRSAGWRRLVAIRRGGLAGLTGILAASARQPGPDGPWEPVWSMRSPTT